MIIRLIKSNEYAVAANSTTGLQDVVNRPLIDVFIASGLNINDDFDGFAKRVHTHKLSEIFGSRIDNAITFKENVTVEKQIISSLADGTPPLQVVSTTEVTNLNAEMVGGKKLADLAQKATTLAGYGIENAYTKDEVDAAIADSGGNAGNNGWVEQFGIPTDSSSSFLQKGVLIEPEETFKVYRVLFLSTADATNIFEARIYQIDASSNQVGAALAISSNTRNSTGVLTRLEFKFTTPVTLSTGNRYVIVCANKKVGATACLLSFVSTGANVSFVDTRYGFKNMAARIAELNPANGAAWDIATSPFCFAMLYGY